ncbi:MAG: hypothetical protein H7138_05475 [Myxococcales bacterium]|nr:hypothetical protein [Myxococcales bacterium]
MSNYPFTSTINYSSSGGFAPPAVCIALGGQITLNRTDDGNGEVDTGVAIFSNENGTLSPPYGPGTYQLLPNISGMINLSIFPIPPTCTPQNGKINAGSTDDASNQNTLGLNVLFAGYGTARNGFDVTTQCQALLNSGVGITPTNYTSAIGSPLNFNDPDWGTQKSFGILYQSPILNNGAPLALGAVEVHPNTSGQLPPPTSPASLAGVDPQPPDAVVLPISATVPQVLYAVYGSMSEGRNVTGECQALLNAGQTSITATANKLGLTGVSDDATWNLCIKYAISPVPSPPAQNPLMYVLACPNGSTINILT